MFVVEADGSAVVKGIPVSPFVPVQHMQMDVSTVNRIANFGLKYARERGWLHPSRDIGKSSENDTHSIRPLTVVVIEDEGYSAKDGNTTFFYAGTEASLATPHSNFTDNHVSSTVLLWCRFRLAHVGSSSYSVYGEIATYEETHEEERQALGVFKVTTVQVSKTLRTPTPMSPDKRDMFLRVFTGTQKTIEALGAGARVQRMDTAALLLASGWVKDPANLLDVQIAGPTCAVLDGAELFLTYKHTYKLRDTDIDFNGHVNQLVSTQLIISVFRKALRDPACVLHRLRDSNVPPLLGDLLLTKFRIDYVHEVPMSCESMEVYIFPADAESGRMITTSKEGTRFGKQAALGFATLGIAPKGSRFVATVGMMYSSV